MQPTVQPRQYDTRYLTRRYIVALSAIALLAILGQLLIQFALVQQSSDASIINIAGRQRMLSQRLSKASLALLFTDDEGQRQTRLNELTTVADLWESSAQTLQSGRQGQPANSPEVTQLFTEIDPYFREMLVSARCLVSLSSVETADSACDSDLTVHVENVLANEGLFLQGMERIVARYELEATDRVNQLKVIEISLLVITLVVLALEAVLIFQPAIRKIRQTLAELQNTQAELQKSQVELERRVEERTKELRVATQEAREASRLKDEFLAVMSHELRTPLNAIIGFMGIMNMSGKLDEKSRHMVQRARANAERLLQLINDILDISRIESGRIQLVPVAISIRDMVERLQSQMGVLAQEKGLDFKISVDSDMPETVYADEDAVLKITTNLLSNAFKFTDKGHVALDLKHTDENWLLEVSDTGIGIPVHMQDVIFDKFRQADASAKRSRGGSGLGLAIVRQLCMSMNGSIRVSSTPGEGSKFIVALPFQSPNVALN